MGHYVTVPLQRTVQGAAVDKNEHGICRRRATFELAKPVAIAFSSIAIGRRWHGALESAVGAARWGEVVDRPQHGIVEMTLTDNALRILEARYLRRDRGGQIAETPDEWWIGRPGFRKST